MSHFTKAFEKFLENYFLEVKPEEIISDNLNLYHAQADDLYSQVENLLDEKGKVFLQELEECFLLEMVEKNRKYFISGFRKAIELNKYLNK